MASSTLDETLVTYLKSHAPNNAADETDAVKASQALFPEVTYTDSEKTELSQWLATAAHIASSTEDVAKSSERLSSLNTHLASRTTVLGTKPSVADIALYQKLAPVVQKWSAEERTGEQGYHHIVRHVDFVQNSPIFGLKLDDKVNVDQDNVVFKIKPVDAKAEKERKKKEKEAAAANAAASGATPTTLTGEQGGQGGKSKKDKAKDKAQAAGEAVASAVVGNPSSGGSAGGPPEGAPTKKKEKKEKQPKPQKAYVVADPPHHTKTDSKTEPQSRSPSRPPSSTSALATSSKPRLTLTPTLSTLAQSHAVTLPAPTTHLNTKARSYEPSAQVSMVSSPSPKCKIARLSLYATLSPSPCAASSHAPWCLLRHRG
jgi:aminoacyl tRNA synthase complex-interacting multifunctional protein 1